MRVDLAEVIDLAALVVFVTDFTGVLAIVLADLAVLAVLTAVFPAARVAVAVAGVIVKLR